MPSVEFDTTENLTTLAKATLRQAVREVFGSAPVNFVRKRNALLHFGVTAPSATEMAVKGDVRAVATAIRNALPKSPKTPWDGIHAPETILYLDIETHEVERMWDMPLREFFRLGQFAWGPEGDIDLTTDLDEVLDACKRANGIVAHNGHQFDFSVLLGDEALRYAQAGKLFDTMLFANLAFPAPYMFKMRPKEGGKPRTVVTEGKPEMVSMWLSLDNLAYQLNVDGKEGDLKALAKEFGGFGLIPTNDPRYEDYARGDIRMLQAITTDLISMHPVSQYDRREQLKGAIAAQMSRNGFRVNVPAAKARVAELAERKEVLLADLDARYGFPTEGKMPWRTNKGKEAILNALADYGITPETRPSWPQLKTGPSLGGKVLLELTEDTEAEELGITLAELQGQRSLAQQALDYVHDDSRVHPSITLWQRSGRSSITKPGLTTWGERNPIDKGYLIASEGHKLVEFDLSNADQRIVAALSGDTEYAKRFLPDADGHEITGRLMFGNAQYDTNPKAHRNIAKACIAEGQLVLTDQGLVPIEKVSACMLVWDGVGWVAHSGLLYRGEREVITYGGLTATRDHVVYATYESTNVEVPFGVAAALGLTLTTTGAGGVAIRVGDDYQSRTVLQPETQQLLRRGPLHTLWAKWLGYLGQLGAGLISWLPTLWSRGDISVPRVDFSPFDGRKTALREPEKTRVPVLRRSWCPIQLFGYARSLAIRIQQSLAIRPPAGNRPNRHERALRTGEPQNGYATAKHRKPTCYGLDALRSAVLAVCEKCRSSLTERWADARRNHRAGTLRRGRKAKELAGYSTTARVYDLYLAGPRNRFTVSNVLVHNCSHAYAYGAGSKTLAATAKQPLELAEKFVDAMKRAYPGVIAWQNRVRAEGEKGSVRNRWGRVMQIDRDSAYTQAPAAFGQSGTAEIIWDGLIEMLERDRRLITWVVCMIHDALLFDFPEDQLDYAVPMVVECMEQNINGIEFPVGHGPAGDTWQDARHG